MPKIIKIIDERETQKQNKKTNKKKNNGDGSYSERVREINDFVERLSPNSM